MQLPPLRVYWTPGHRSLPITHRPAGPRASWPQLEQEGWMCRDKSLLARPSPPSDSPHLLTAAEDPATGPSAASPWMPFEMPPFCCWGLPAALLALLFCPGSGEEAFEVYVSPEQLVVKHGGSSEINCSTSCLQPTISGLETTLSKILLDKQPQWELYRVLNVSKDTVVYCHFTCSGKQMQRNASITAFYPPEQVLLKLQPTWVTVGKVFTMECRVPAVAPLENLTLTLLRGQETLHMQRFEGATATPQEAMITHNSTAHKEDGGHNFSCRAELDLQPRGGGLIQRTSEPQVLEIHEPVPDNQMVIIIVVVSVLLGLFVAAVLLCFVFGQQWHQRRRGNYGVQAAWRRLRRSYRA